jgi:pimeloyl-ACP methyl ester carboxylesterase
VRVTRAWTRHSVSVSVDGAALEIDTLSRLGPSAPVVFLHGFGGTKEDYADFARFPRLTEIPFLAYDAPGFGQSVTTNATQVSIPFLIEVARAVLARLEVEKFHLVGHSMGGLTALMLADQAPHRVESFIDIEGNLTPEDCFLSRQILTHPTEDPSAFLNEFAARTHPAPEFSSALYAANVRSKVNPAVVTGVFESMVHLSDHGALLAKFTALRCPRMFVYGEQNAALTYLPTLRAHGVELAEIPFSGHWPMYSNPVAMWTEIANFYSRHSQLRVDAER